MTSSTTPEQPPRLTLVRILVPLAFVVLSILDAWRKFINGLFNAQWQHYAALVGLLVVSVLLVMRRKWGVLALGIYLILAITTVFSITQEVSYFGITLGETTVPLGNMKAWGIFILYIAANAPTLGQYYLDYKESRGSL